MPKTNAVLAAEFAQNGNHNGKLLFEEETMSFWIFNGKVWSLYPKEKMRQAVARLVWNTDPDNKMTVGKQMDVVAQVADFLGDGINGVKCGHKVRRLEEKGISFSDGILLFEKMEVVPHGPDLDRVALVHLDFPYASLPDAKCQLFDSYVKTTCSDAEGNYKEGMEKQLQEIAGFALSNERVEKAIILFGKGANGKSPFLDLLEAALGEERCASMSMEDLSTDRFATSSLLGKKANILDEDESERIKISKLKAIISGRPMSTQKKFQDRVRARISIKCFFSTNKEPEIDVSEYSIRRRFLIIPFEHTLPKDEKTHDRYLAVKIIRDEMPGVIRWMLEGMRRLVSNNCVFTSTDESEAMMAVVEASNSSVSEYLKNNWVTDSATTTPVFSIYSAYLEWCKDNGRKNPVSSNKFGRQASLILGKSFITTYQSRHCACYRVRPIDEPVQNPFV